MLSTYTRYQMLTRSMETSLHRVATQPQTARESAYYLAHIEDIKSIDDFLGNQRVFAYAMKAFGLSDMTYAKGFMRKILTEGVDSPQSLANKMTDPRYREFVSTFNFARYKDTTTIFEATRQKTVDRYVTQTLEAQAGEDDQGVRLALYFNRKAGNLKSIYGILADPALLRVVQVAFDLPQSLSVLPIERQAEIIGQKVSLETLKKPDGLKNVLNRFMAQWSLSQGESTAQAPALQVLTSSVSPGISAQTLFALSSLRLNR